MSTPKNLIVIDSRGKLCHVGHFVALSAKLFYDLSVYAFVSQETHRQDQAALSGMGPTTSARNTCTA